ncbi:response regulator [Paenibacillus sonchi]|uniref:Response regulator n=1 Tax=Paenibacillus sonchi TaxID=373687 RepID=A0A974PD30_9BACL|nr:helix-turn-helix domain-containing protein [Paenibacillus sonchi]QQZ61296.1 response regulator [Paenibacillus sonchi]
MNILIADDEHLVRLSLKNALLKMNWNENNIHEATDGTEFLHMLSELCPEIAFVDIKMPYINGLEAIEKGQRLSPNTEFIIITGFSEFEYAKKAIELQVTDFLLKPVSFEQLMLLIDKISDKVHKKNLTLNRTFTSQITSFLSGDKSQFNSDDLIDNETSHYKLVWISIHEHALSGGNTLEEDNLFRKVKACADRYISAQYRAALIYVSTTERLLICSHDKRYEADSRASIDALVNDVKTLSLQYFNQDKKIVSLITSETFESNLNLLNNYAKLTKLSCLRAVLGIQQSYALSFLEHMDREFPSYLALSQLSLQISNMYREKKFIEFHLLIDRWIKMMEQNKLYEKKKLLEATIIYFRYTIGIQAATNASFLELSDALQHLSINVLRAHTNKTNYMDAILEFINHNFMHNISIAMLAEMFDLSPNYISTIFHKTIGQKFIEYITQLRIAEAKKLLLETDLSIQEISHKVGYYSKSHFIKLFSKHCKITPMEYKKMKL